MLPPVLLLVYNRPDHTRKVVKRLMELGVTELYVSADGAKDVADQKVCEAARAACIQDGLNLFSSFSDRHRGCRDGVIHGINWFFSQVEEGIVLEDDCLPNAAFFRFCADLLKRHPNDSDIYMISGNNPLGVWESGHSHHFARIGHVWGWASWSDRWKGFDPSLPQLNPFTESNGFTRLWGNTGLPITLRTQVEKAVAGKIDTWDFQWTMHHAMQGKLAAIPHVNLVENTGFENTATHTVSLPNWISNKVSDEPFDLTYPAHQPDREYEFSLHLAKELNAPAPRSAGHFQIVSKTAHQKLRIVQANSTDQGGGAESVVMQHHLKLLELGHHATLLVDSKQSDAHGVVVLEDSIDRQLEEMKPDVVHLHNVHGTRLTLDAIGRIADRYPVLWTLHDSWTVTGSQTHPFCTTPEKLSFLDREDWVEELRHRSELLRHANIRLTAPSHWLRNGLLKMHGLSSHFVPNTLPSIDPESIPERKPYLLFVANHADRNPYKDFHTLQKAWEQANAAMQHPGVDLICVGGKPDERTIFGNTFLVLDRQPPSTILGLMQGAVALVQASLQDNAPMTILEAHRMGTPVIGAMVGGIPEMLSPVESALLYRPENVEELTKSVIEAVLHQQVLRTAVREYFSQQDHKLTMTDTFIGHYLDLHNG